MEQPAGTVEGSATLYKARGSNTGDWWQVSRHALGSRVRFWERVYTGTPSQMVLISERQTDDIWGKEAADEWYAVQAGSRIRSGYAVVQSDGVPGPSTTTSTQTRKQG